MTTMTTMTRVVGSLPIKTWSQVQSQNIQLQVCSKHKELNNKEENSRGKQNSNKTRQKKKKQPRKKRTLTRQNLRQKHCF